MGKKNKNLQPNAPELQQILLDNTSRQPPRNPYYPDLGTDSALLPPPPYSDLSVSSQEWNYNPRMSQNPARPADYPRFTAQSAAPPAAVIIQQQPTRYVDRKAERQQKNVRKFNGQLLIIALIAIGLSMYAHSLYRYRPCIDFLVHAPAKDISITVYTVQKMHHYVAYGSIFLLLICLAKCSGGNSRSHSCYLFMVGLTTLVGTLFTGYLAYLAFYSPCSLKISELAANSLKTFVGSLVNTLPSPEQRVFGESNVFDLGKEDKNGVIIFLIDLFNFVLYLSGFVSATSLC